MRAYLGTGGLPDLKPLSDIPGLPRSKRWLAVLTVCCLAAAPVGYLGWHTLEAASAPSSLSQSHLIGARGPGCVRLAIAEDDSASMNEFAPARDAALGELLSWSAGQLQPNDQLTVVAWAASSSVILPTTDANQATAAALQAAPGLTPGSSLSAAADGIAASGTTSCKTLAVVLSDGKIAERDPAAMRQKWEDAGVDAVVLLMPDTSMREPGEWSHAVPYATASSFDGNDPEATALAMGEALADYLGMDLRG